MHDQAGIALFFGDVLTVVVNTMTIKGERRKTEQQHLVGGNVTLPCWVLRSWSWLHHRIGGVGRWAVNDVVLFRQTQTLCVMHLMLNQYK